jgi:hypothetical protein
LIRVTDLSVVIHFWGSPHKKNTKNQKNFGRKHKNISVRKEHRGTQKIAKDWSRKINHFARKGLIARK